MRWMMLIGTAVWLCSCALPEGKDTSAAGQSASPLSSREQALIFAADGAAQRGDTAAAERDYRAAMALSDTHIDAYMGLAQLYLHNNDREKARSVLEQALALRFEDPLANYLMGKLYIDSGEYDKAGEAFQRGLITKPDDLDLGIGLAVAKDMRSQHAEAQAIYQRVMAQHPDADLTNLRTDLAMSYLLSKQTARAIELLRSDAAKPNAPSVTRHNLALAYGLEGRDNEARELLRGEIDEHTRIQGIARLREYLTKHPSNAPPPSSAEVIVTEKPAMAKPQKKHTPAKKSAPDHVAPARPAPIEAIPEDFPTALPK